jgi:hypothetical protein
MHFKGLKIQNNHLKRKTYRTVTFLMEQMIVSKGKFHVDNALLAQIIAKD